MNGRLIHGSLADSLPIVLPALGPALLTSGAAERLLSTARSLAPVHRAGFECRLEADAERVDLQQGISHDDDEPGTVAEYVAWARAQRGVEQHEGWDRVHALCTEWQDPGSLLHDAITELWLEVDIDPSRPESTTPCIFVAFRAPEASGRASTARVESALATVLGHELPTHIRACLTRCAEACPEPAFVSHVGVMLSRETRGIRVHVSGLRLDDWRRYLPHVGWPGDERRAHALGQQLLEIADYVSICFEMTDRLQPALGLEAFFHQKHGLDPRWTFLLTWLVRRGLCEPAKRDALLAWPGLVTPWMASAPWPASLIAQSMVVPGDEMLVFDRRLSHVKITCASGRDDSAKAYFGFGPIRSRFKPRAAITSPVAAAAPGPLHPQSVPRLRVADSTPVGSDEAVRAAVAYLMRTRNQAGWWRDFFDILSPPGHHGVGSSSAGDAWATAYAGAALAAVPDDAASAGARHAWGLLRGRRGAADAWGYHAQLPPDADTTAWALRLARAVDARETRRTQGARRFLEEQIADTGGLASYRRKDGARLGRFINVESTYDGLCGVHTCVTAAASVLDLGDRPIDYLLREQREDGRWVGYWWEDDEYATALAVEGLWRSGRQDARDAAVRAARWARSRLDETGAVYSVRHEGESEFATALCVRILSSVPATDEADALVRRGVDWLLNRQLADGSFAATARMRIPTPGVLDAEADLPGKRIFIDRNRTFTTATALVALVQAGGSIR